MPRPNTGPKLKPNKRGVFEIRWTECGITRRISTRTRDAVAAQEALKHFLLAEERQSLPSGLTVEEAWAIYWQEHVRDNVVDKARLKYAWKWLEPELGAMRLNQMVPKDFQRYRDHRRVAGVKDSTVRRELSALEACINHLITTKRVNATDTPYVAKPKGSAPRQRWLTEKEINALVAKAEARRPYPKDRLSRIERFLHIALRTGQRKRSIEQLSWAQVDFERGLIDFNGGRLQTKKRRPTIPIPAKLLPVLKRAQDERKSPTGGFVLDHPGAIRKSFERLAEAAGLPDVTPHVLRHTWATHAAMNGVSLVDIARVLGNSVAMVERVYSKWAPEYLRSAVNQEARRERQPEPSEARVLPDGTVVVWDGQRWAEAGKLQPMVKEEAAVYNDRKRRIITRCCAPLLAKPTKQGTVSRGTY